MTKIISLKVRVISHSFMTTNSNKKQNCFLIISLNCNYLVLHKTLQHLYLDSLRFKGWIYLFQIIMNSHVFCSVRILYLVLLLGIFAWLRIKWKLQQIAIGFKMWYLSDTDIFILFSQSACLVNEFHILHGGMPILL